jgi:hypothetical protein
MNIAAPKRPVRYGNMHRRIFSAFGFASFRTERPWATVNHKLQSGDRCNRLKEAKLFTQ